MREHWSTLRIRNCIIHVKDAVPFRASEDVTELSLEQFSEFYEELRKNDFWCINAESPEEIHDYLMSNLGVRFCRENQAIPNFEVKFPKRDIDKEIFQDFLIVNLSGGKIKISSLERHIAFKKYYLGTDKDVEDAEHIEKTFKGQIDYEKINKFSNIIEMIKDEGGKK